MRSASRPAPTHRRILPDVTDLLFRHFGRIAAVTCLTIGTALVYNAVYGPSYTASVRVLVTPSGGTVGAGGGLPDGGSTLVVADHGQTARNQAELLNDHGLISKFLPAASAAPAARAGLLPMLAQRAGERWRRIGVRLGLLSPASAQELLAARLSHAVTARAVGDTDVVRLDFTWDDRFFAASAVNQVLAGYQRAIAGAADARAALRQAQVRQAEAEADLSGTMSRGGEQAVDLNGEKNAMQARVEAARTQADRLRLDRELARHKLEQVQHEYENGGWVDGADKDSFTQDLADSFASLLKQRADLQSDPHPSARAIRRVDAEINEVRQQNYRAAQLALNSKVDTMSERLQSVEDGMTRDQAALRTLDTQSAEADLVAQTQAARQARATEARRRTLEASTRVDAVWQEVGSTRALSEAGVPAEPDFPAPSLLVDMATLIGVLLGLGGAMLAERRRATIDRPADVARHLDIEVLARLRDVPIARLEAPAL